MRLRQPLIRRAASSPNNRGKRSAYFAYLGLLTIRDGDDATILDAASADGAIDVDSPT
jgi:hypothetical protein